MRRIDNLATRLGPLEQADEDDYPEEEQAQCHVPLDLPDVAKHAKRLLVARLNRAPGARSWSRGRPCR